MTDMDAAIAEAGMILDKTDIPPEPSPGEPFYCTLRRTWLELRRRLAEAAVVAAATREALEAVQWVDGEGVDRHCEVCGMPESFGHTTGCGLAAALAPDAGKALLARLEQARADAAAMRRVLERFQWADTYSDEPYPPGHMKRQKNRCRACGQHEEAGTHFSDCVVAAALAPDAGKALLARLEAAEQERDEAVKRATVERDVATAAAEDAERAEANCVVMREGLETARATLVQYAHDDRDAGELHGFGTYSEPGERLIPILSAIDDALAPDAGKMLLAELERLRAIATTAAEYLRALNDALQAPEEGTHAEALHDVEVERYNELVAAVDPRPTTANATRTCSCEAADAGTLDRELAREMHEWLDADLSTPLDAAPTPRRWTVRDILVDWLQSHGYDGLYWQDGGETCGCPVERLAPCQEGPVWHGNGGGAGCVPGYRHSDGLMYPEAQP